MAVNDIYECTASQLYIRKGPSITSPTIGTITKGSRIKEITIEGNWLKHSAGYSSLKYLKKISSSTVNTVSTDSEADTFNQQTINEESGLNSDGTAGSGNDPNSMTNGSAVKEFTSSLGKTFKEDLSCNKSLALAEPKAMRPDSLSKS